MAVRCEKCGVRVASRAALPGHYRRAHRSGEVPSRLVSPQRVRAEVLDVKSIPSIIAQPQMLKTVYANKGKIVRCEASSAVFFSRADSEALLVAQYHFLKALAAKLDGGIGTPEDERKFWAGLAEYRAHGERMRATWQRSDDRRENAAEVRHPMWAASLEPHSKDVRR